MKYIVFHSAYYNLGSHRRCFVLTQAYGSAQAAGIKLLLERHVPGARVCGPNDWSQDRRKAIAESSAFLLYLTADVFNISDILVRCNALIQGHCRRPRALCSRVSLPCTLTCDQSVTCQADIREAQRLDKKIVLVEEVRA